MTNITFERAKNIIWRFKLNDDNNDDSNYTATKKAYADIRGKVDSKHQSKFNNWYKSLNLK